MVAKSSEKFKWLAGYQKNISEEQRNKIEVKTETSKSKEEK